MPRLSSSASTSSGTRPLTRTAYMPRTFPAVLQLEYPSTGPVKLQGGDLHVRCHRPTQLVSGSINAIIPSKYVEVQDWIRSGEPFNCMRRWVKGDLSGGGGDEPEGSLHSWGNHFCESLQEFE